MVGLGGLEPPTSPLSGARSSHLSYRPAEDTALQESKHDRCCVAIRSSRTVRRKR